MPGNPFSAGHGHAYIHGEVGRAGWGVAFGGMRRAYLFEAKGIQPWILAGDRLRDIAAASALLAWIAGDGDDLLSLVLDQTGFSPTPSRRAGGAFMLHFDDGDPVFDRFRNLWRLTFMRLAPGLEFSEGLSEPLQTDSEAAGSAYSLGRRLSAARENGPATLLPLGHLLSDVARRTGAPASLSYPGGDLIDAATQAKRRANRFRDAVGERLNEAFDAPLRWPNRMPGDKDLSDTRDAIAFPAGEDDWIAVAHADVSGLGAFFTDVRNQVDNPGAVAEAARAVEAAVTQAAAIACQEVLAPAAGPDRVAPARPVLLGGDDITLILRGDVALAFMATFLEALEEESTRRLSQFARDHQVRGGFDLPLTAAAGVVFAGARQPFFRLLTLAEDLCGHAKAAAKRTQGAAVAKRPASVLSFWRATESALSARAGDLLARAPASCQPYRLGGVLTSGLAEFSGLEAVLESLDSDVLEPGPLRKARGLLAKNRVSEAEAVWERWRAMAKARPGGAKALAKLEGGLRAAWPKGGLGVGDPAGRTALFDAMDWRAVVGAE